MKTIDLCKFLICFFLIPLAFHTENVEKLNPEAIDKSTISSNAGDWVQWSEVDSCLGIVTPDLICDQDNLSAHFPADIKSTFSKNSFSQNASLRVDGQISGLNAGVPKKPFWRLKGNVLWIANLNPDDMEDIRVTIRFNLPNATTYHIKIPPVARVYYPVDYSCEVSECL